MVTSSPISPLLVVLVIAIIVVTIFAWAWAVRRPVPRATTGDEAVTVPDVFVYAAIGASDVEGIGADDPQNDSWVVLLQKKLPLDSRLVRLGRGGITLSEANMVEVPRAAASDPDLVTMWNCVNDATRGVPLESYLRDLKSALDLLTSKTHAQILLLNLPDLALLIPGVDETRRTLVRGGIHQWNNAMAATAATYLGRVTVVDLFPASARLMEDPGLVSADSFHPSTSGYRWLSEHVWGVICEKHLHGSA